ncbi:nucleotide sugar dehydrogenase [Natrialbaceae archaeon GCM10025810]|uniref:nucleotide sugar dehydrogenase n=1 Tax=Halovalidus salilacus TaxID=3075124 RepID=UPI00360BAEB8
MNETSDATEAVDDATDASGPATVADGPYGSNASERTQREALTGGDVPVAVYGLGKMGLPLAAVYADTTGNVTGVDVDPSVVETVEDGGCHVVGEPGLADLVAEQVDRGRLEATTDGVDAASRASIHVVIVPTLIDDDGSPNLTTVESVIDDIAAGLAPGDLVIAESTLPPGSCRDVLAPHLEAESGLEVGEFGLAFCPERTSSGTALRDIRGRYPKVVGGIDDESSRAAALVYDKLSSNEIRVVSDATTAEAVKVFEGVYRDVNIALANELGTLADELGISVREAFETANDLPMCQLHDPGPGVGGHCIPYYPHFLLDWLETELPLTRRARTVNEGMPALTVDRLERALEDAGEDADLSEANVVVLGVTYRPGVAETRASPAVGVIEALADRGATVHAVDPLVDPAEYGARPLEVDDLPERSTDFDAAVVVTPHEEFDRIAWADLDPMIVVDGRDAFEAALEGTDHRRYTLGGTGGGRPPTESSAPEADSADGTTPEAPRSTARRTDGGDR